jgi:adenosylcobyric acid synthase
MSNFTDFDNLERISEVHLYYTNSPDEIEKADIIILPGSKNTIDDLQYLRKNGIEDSIRVMHKKGKQVYGICGGYQMMGKKIFDPHKIESEIPEINGLDILPISTTLTTNKKTSQVKFNFLDTKEECHGYEIHMGITKSETGSPLCNTPDNTDGYYLNNRTWGTYIHGIFDNPVVVGHILKQVKEDIQVDFNFKAFKEQEFDKLAQLVRSSVDMEFIYKKLQK